MEKHRWKVVGIDPGLTGGVAILLGDELVSEILYAVRLPVVELSNGKREIDVSTLKYNIARCSLGHLDLAVIEQVNAMPKQGVTSTFTFGQTFGELLAVTKLIGCNIERPRPRDWKKAVLPVVSSNKQVSIDFVKTSWPEVDLKATTRSKKDHDGIADAICLAQYGLKQLAHEH